jgi:hypothetical protein
MQKEECLIATNQFFPWRCLLIYQVRGGRGGRRERRKGRGE